MNRLLAAIAWRYLNESMWAWAAERDAEMVTEPQEAHEHDERLSYHSSRALMLANIMRMGNEHAEQARLDSLLNDLNDEVNSAYGEALAEMRRLRKIADEPPF